MAEESAAWNYVPYVTVYWEELYRGYKITGGLFLQKAMHDFDYMGYLTDSPIIRIGAMATFRKVFGGKKPAGLACSKCGETDTCLESPVNRKRNNSGPHEKDHHCVYSRDCGQGKQGRTKILPARFWSLLPASTEYIRRSFFSRRDAAARGSTVSG